MQKWKSPKPKCQKTVQQQEKRPPHRKKEDSFQEGVRAQHAENRDATSHIHPSKAKLPS